MSSTHAGSTAASGKPILKSVPRLSLRENLAAVSAIRRDQLEFMQNAVRNHGDIFHMRLGGLPMIMVNHPDHFQRVLVDNHPNYDKDNFLYRAVRSVLREGLIGNIGGESWRHHRRLMQPSFHRSRVADFVVNITDLTAELFRRWESQLYVDDLVDVTTEIADLALRIVLRSLFGVDMDERSRKFAEEFVEVNTIVGDFFRFPFPPLSWRTPSRNRLRTLIKEMDGFVSHLIQARTSDDSERNDLFTRLLNARDAKTGTGLTPGQLANEILAMIVAGYETSSNSISWIFYQLAEHQEIQRRVQDEVDDVLGGRPPTFDDLPKLTYTGMVIDETLRLFTPAWHTMRHAIEEDVIGGYHIPKGSNIYLNLFIYHRHPDFWPEPTRFNPERFSPEEVAKRPRNLYQPYGSGPRLCIGKHFAQAELLIMAAMFAQTFHVTRPQGQPPVGFAPLITLHPKGGIHLRLRRR
ncbi:cytochrome P450 [Streptosporangium becharense]|uniref:Cytochrome P450 n=1 Tax=Streptosporangium becharense TaxID=1816182 RepID=A0A7W9IMZ7_9ACTN|nr:cytochrome P450 [Streptosporangium becharense]MBB2910360.1 cytochrome P450 [Streptosporangium becharense]MBB5823103.1 cytochrome P450 [Streptosporangium becharense]